MSTVFCIFVKSEDSGEKRSLWEREADSKDGAKKGWEKKWKKLRLFFLTEEWGAMGGWKDGEDGEVW